MVHRATLNEYPVNLPVEGLMRFLSLKRIFAYVFVSFLILAASAALNTGRAAPLHELSPPAVSRQTPPAAPPPIDYQFYERDLIQLKFKNGLSIRLRNGQPTDLTRRALNSARSVAAFSAVRDGAWMRGSSLSEVELTTMLRRAEQRSGQTVPDLNLIFRLKLPPGMDAAAAIDLFGSLPEVEWAAPVPKPQALPSPPDYETGNADNFDAGLNRNVYQRYLDPAPEGLNFRYAWQGQGGTAAGIKICDVEYGWNSDHTDLPTVTLLGDDPDSDVTGNWWEHGTAVIGELAALNNGWGTTGMAYGADIYFAAAVTVAGGYNMADAVTRCANGLSAGDVILIEQQISGPNRPSNPASGDQTGLVAAEWDVSTYNAIQAAVALGIVVVEAAGNGGEDLDAAEYCPASGTGSHCPFKTSNDSGAIIVGAGRSPYLSSSRSRAGFSNFGATVDVQSWGDRIMTTGYGTYYSAEGKNLWYRDTFGGTSGASPMVTAAVAIVQATYTLRDGSPASPATVKSLLQTTGTAQVGADNIGPQPDLKAAINSIWGVTPPVAPTISPAGGTYNMPMQVQIGYGSPSQNRTNTNIRYTLDGSDPTPDSFIFIPEFGDTIYLNYGATVKAKAFQYSSTAGRSFESSTTGVTYVSSTPKVATPSISPGGGFYSQPHQVTLSTTTPGATIKYRTDGRTPSFFYPGTLYTGPITLNPGSYRIKARAYKDGYYKNDVADSGAIDVTPTTLPSPTIYPNGGDFGGEVTVYLGSTVLGAEIHYTLDGSTPTATSPLYVNSIALTQTVTLKAIATLSGYTDSASVSATFNVVGQVAAPVITPGSGTALDSVLVSISTTTPNAEIRYTTNGAEPNGYSTLYTAPFSLGIGLHTVRAKAFFSGAAISPEASANYTVYDSANLTATPVTTPPGGTFNGPLTVTITSDTEGALITYTTDGTDPYSSPSVQVYSGPFTVVGNTTYYIKARAWKSSSGLSNLSAIATLTVVTPTLGTVVTPTFSVPGGTYTNTFTLVVAAPDYLSPFRVRRLFISTDGVTPTVDFSGGSSGLGTNVSISGATTVKAIAGQSGWFDSPMISADYVLQCDTPTINPNGGTFTDTATITLTTGTNLANIYYTTNGEEPISTPTVTITQYSSSFTLPVGTHTVKAKCFRTNFDASDTAISVITVNPTPVAPTVLTHPAPQNTGVGNAITFTAEITAVPDAAYQWQKDGINLAGETETTLVLPAARLGDAGDYRLVASNDAGVVTTTVAALTVNPISTTLSISKLANTTAITAGGRITYTLTLTNSGSVSATAQVVDTLAPVSAVAAITADNGGCQSAVGGTFTCTIGLTTTAPTILHVYVDTIATFSGTLTNTAVITGAGDYANTNPSNTTGAVTVSVFTPTVVAGDTTPPTVDSVIPADSSSNIPRNDPLEIIFSEAMNTASVNVSLSPGVSLSPAWSLGDTKMTLTHADFSASTPYTASITAGTDVAGNPLSGLPYTWVFTTGAVAAPTADLSAGLTRQGSGTVTAGGSITFTLAITNAGPTTPVTATVVATFSDATALSAVGGAGCSWTPGATDVTCTVTGVSTGGVSTVVLPVTTQSSFSGTLTVNISVDPVGGVVDDNAANNSAGPVNVSVAIASTAPSYFVYLPLVLK